MRKMILGTKEVLTRAIKAAIANGWDVFGLCQKDGFEYILWEEDAIHIRYWAQPTRQLHAHRYAPLREIIFNLDFAKALFGWEQVNQKGIPLVWLKLYFRQIAVEHLGKTYAVNGETGDMTFLSMKNPLEVLDEARDAGELTTKSEINEVTYRLQTIKERIPVNLFRLEDCSLESEPAWQYHLRQMVIEKEPLEYLRKWMEEECERK